MQINYLNGVTSELTFDEWEAKQFEQAYEEIKAGKWKPEESEYLTKNNILLSKEEIAELENTERGYPVHDSKIFDVEMPERITVADRIEF